MSLVKVEEREGRGRCVVACKQIKRGSVCVQETATCAIVFPQFSEHVSHLSFVTSGNLLRCSKTKFAKYLNAEEQRGDWERGFREESKAILASVEKRTMPTLLRLAARLVWLSHKDKSIQHKVERLIDHANDTDNREVLETFALMSKGLERYTRQGMLKEKNEEDQEGALSIQVDALFRLLLKLSVNVHSITDAEMNAVGLGIFLDVGCFVNHADRPNCVQIFSFSKGSRPKMLLVALDNIAAGEELCISYVDPGASWLDKHAVLTEQYHIPSNDKVREMASQGEWKVLVLPREVTRECTDALQVYRSHSVIGPSRKVVGLSSHFVPVDVLEQEDDQLLEKVLPGSQLMPLLKLVDNDGEDAWKTKETQVKLVERLEKETGIGAESLRLASLQACLKEALGRCEYEVALSAATASDAIMRERYPHGWPSLGLHFAALAKLHNYFGEDVQTTKEVAKLALENLSICYGDGGERLGDQIEGRALFRLLEDIVRY